jgi:hypothetical protein
VCGADGRTYPNRCEAERARVEVAREGACDAPATAPPAPLLPHGGSPRR